MLGKVVELSLVLMLSRFDDVDFVFASELKIMNGDSSVNASIPKTKYVFNLRDHQSGNYTFNNKITYAGSVSLKKSYYINLIFF